MSDVLPKLKLYTLISIMTMILNIGIYLTKLEFDILGLFASIGTAFIPFTSFIPLLTSGLPLEVITFLGLITGIFSGIQTFIIAMIVLQTVNNLIWSPDV